jgi:hypothetical protein
MAGACDEASAYLQRLAKLCVGGRKGGALAPPQGSAAIWGFSP